MTDKKASDLASDVEWAAKSIAACAVSLEKAERDKAAADARFAEALRKLTEYATTQKGDAEP